MISVLWRNLEVPGHDHARLLREGRDWVLEGMAVFLDERGPARLAYEVTCDEQWHSRHGRVHGWLGPTAVDFAMARTAEGAWTLDGIVVPGLEECVDLDFGFTPATNLFAMRRLNLALGESGDSPAAWLDVSAGALLFLPQRYERRGELAYWYESPTAGYAAELAVNEAGFTRVYPGLWEMER
ncbi:MAG TPA: putative glycolipid-binding domain-containing protein [Thermoanaerobaculia bacterium]